MEIQEELLDQDQEDLVEVEQVEIQQRELQELQILAAVAAGEDMLEQELEELVVPVLLLSLIQLVNH
jgi:hypothetical protein